MLTLLYLTCQVLLTVVPMLIVGKHMGLVGKIYPYTPPKETGLGTPLGMLLNFLHWLAEQEQLLRSRAGSLDTRMRGMIFPYNDHRLFDCLSRSVRGGTHASP